MKGWLALPVLVLGVSACQKRPSPKECEEAFVQLERIAVEGRDRGSSELGKAYLETFRKAFLGRCANEGTRAEVECIMRSRTLEDLDKCAGAKP
jgi:hypothetical protein